MTTFETDFEQIAENIRYIENRSQNKKDQSQTDHILAPGDDLAETELGCRQMPDLPDGSRSHSKEEARKNDIDQKSRQFTESGKPFRREHLSEGVDGK